MRRFFAPPGPYDHPLPNPRRTCEKECEDICSTLCGIIAIFVCHGTRPYNLSEDDVLSTRHILGWAFQIYMGIEHIGPTCAEWTCRSIDCIDSCIVNTSALIRSLRE